MSELTVLTATPDKRLAAAGYDDGTISVFDAEGRLLASWQAHAAKGSSEDSNGVWGLSFSPDGRVLKSRGPVKAGDAYPEIDLLWDPQDGRPVSAST